MQGFLFVFMMHMALAFDIREHAAIVISITQYNTSVTFGKRDIVGCSGDKFNVFLTVAKSNKVKSIILVRLSKLNEIYS